MATDGIPSMVVAGYDSNFEDIGTSIRVALPSGGHATMGKTPLMRCFTDNELRAEGARRGLWSGDGMWSQTMENIANERDEWKRRAEAAEAKPPLNILMRQRLTGLRGLTSTSGGGMNHRLIFHGSPIVGPVDVLVVQPLTATGSCAICGAAPGAACTKECDDDSVPDELVRPQGFAAWLPDKPIEFGTDRTSPPKHVQMLNAERGPGIAAKPSQSEPLAHLDEDLLCEDA